MPEHEIFAFVFVVATQFACVAYCQNKPNQAAPSKDKPMQRASSNGSSAGKAPEVEPIIDYDFAWDEFYHRSRLIWECRGVQSDKFVSREFCAFKEKVDTQWPDKKIPGYWKPQ